MKRKTKTRFIYKRFHFDAKRNMVVKKERSHYVSWFVDIKTRLPVRSFGGKMGPGVRPC